MATSITAERGKPASLGATIEADGVHFAVYSENADALELCLFDEAGTLETERLELPGSDGGTRFGFVPGLAEGARYGLRAKGPFDPRAGHRFDPSKLLVDPYALRLDRPFLYEPSLAAPPERELDSAAFLPRAIVTAPPRDAEALPFAAPGFTYELLVRAFSQADPEISSELRGTISALAEPRTLDHLARIGIDTIELMPLAAWIDEGHLTARNLTNAWGYNPVTHMAPDPRLSPGGLAEIRRVVAALHERGIRVLLDVVFNHSGEGDDAGPTISYRGLDNRLYYAHEEERPDVLVNVTGTGNTFAAWKEPVACLFVDAARTWVETTGIDGFRYDLATVLGRFPEGFREDAPYFRMIAEDPVLKDRIHLAEPWDIGMGGYQVGRFPKPFLEWQDRFRDDVRKFWRGEDGRIPGLATRLAGSADLYDREGRKPSASVNFVAAHDGFSLADLVMYEEKHNEANGEDNRDGSNDNHSWNNGAEGPTDDPAIIEARGRDMRALLATLMVARGNPMIVAGDEFGRTQKGNNNGYAQDNEITWLDWAGADENLIAFTADLAALRRSHPALVADAFLTGTAQGSALPDVVWRREDGAAMAEPDWHDPARRFLAMDLAAPGADGTTERALVYLNAGRDDATVTLPSPQPERHWTLRLQSDWPALEPRSLDAGAGLIVKARSVFVLVERTEGG
ncbi:MULTISPECIES: glycogen debranching protein GlgX [unclassified Aureimonas]|uniref:glycogen debranching protein GlgX n=1 Tax=unclassified Aureimonas TaxID=2615206 RepID=UPI0006F4BB62|nr:MULTISPECIES: glycogen debranching protein GlgX [unclassified Aureimonas]KQT69725.1 glycogen debranching protein [Aureimonas sp. Leaf427]KQT76123.1 glycogen debranching protein [Aureimonas sp. Leaf460]